jgi:cytoskeletal protein RodZ
MAEIGSTLRESRMRSRIDISEVEVSTKIRAKYLRALENEEWDLLPGPVYVKSFLKTYGDYLGLDSRLLVDEFKRRYERPSDHDVRAMATTARERDRRSSQPSRLSGALLSPRSLIVLALAVIVAALVVIGTHNNKNPAGSGNPTPATTGNGSGHHHRSGNGRQRGGTTTGTGTTDTTGTGTTPVIVRHASVKLVPTATVWICVENQAGKPLMTAGNYSVGQTIPTFHARELLITLGNTGVTMTADGKPYTPTAQAGGAAISMRVTPTSVRPLSPAPTCGQ